VCARASYIILLGEYSFISDETKRRKKDAKRRKNKYYYNLIITV